MKGFAVIQTMSFSMIANEDISIRTFMCKTRDLFLSERSFRFGVVVFLLNSMLYRFYSKP